MELSAVPTGVSEALMRGNLWTDSVGVEATYVVTVFFSIQRCCTTAITTPLILCLKCVWHEGYNQMHNAKILHICGILTRFTSEFITQISIKFDVNIHTENFILIYLTSESIDIGTLSETAFTALAL
jgi:hypothetical protein